MRENKRGVWTISTCHTSPPATRGRQCPYVSDTGSEGLGTWRRVSGVQEKGAGQICGSVTGFDWISGEEHKHFMSMVQTHIYNNCKHYETIQAVICQNHVPRSKRGKTIVGKTQLRVMKDTSESEMSRLVWVLNNRYYWELFGCCRLLFIVLQVCPFGSCMPGLRLGCACLFSFLDLCNPMW